MKRDAGFDRHRGRGKKSEGRKIGDRLYRFYLFAPNIFASLDLPALINFGCRFRWAKGKGQKN
jgi:hypothetical protein